MFRKITFVILALATGACGKEAVQDHGPDFTVESSNIKLSQTGLAEVPLRRADLPTVGPQFKITPTSDDIASVEKKLTCGSVILQSKKVIHPVAPFTFNLAETEFPNLSLLPLKSPCVLAVKLTNNVGSTTTRKIPIQLTFDKGPQISGYLQYLPVGLASVPSNLLVPVESYVVKNNLGFPAYFLFQPKYDYVYRSGIITSLNFNGMPRELAVITGKTREKAFVADTPDSPAGLEHLSNGSLRFALKANEEVRIVSYMPLPGGVFSNASGGIIQVSESDQKFINVDSIHRDPSLFVSPSPIKENFIKDTAIPDQISPVFLQEQPMVDLSLARIKAQIRK